MTSAALSFGLTIEEVNQAGSEGWVRHCNHFRVNVIIVWRTILFADCLNDMVQLTGIDSPIVAQISQFDNLSLSQELNHFQLIFHRYLEVFVEVFFFQMLAAEAGVKKYSCLLITIKTVRM